MSNQAKVEVYYWTTCPHCIKLRSFLDGKGIEYIGHDITGDPAGKDKLAELTGGPKTVPQIFINGDYFGDEDDLYPLDAAGTLDSLLKG